MPDLSSKATHQFWNQYRDSNIYRVITFMEGVEDWSYDGDPNVENLLNVLGEELDDIANIDLNELGHEELMLQIGNYLKTGRVLRMLQAIDTIHPGSASKVLIYAEENSHAGNEEASLFLRRNIVFERLRLLSRVFSKDRFNLVLKALEGDEND